MSIEKLLPDRKQRDEIYKLPLSYPHLTGRESLRRNIARFYGGDDPAGVMVPRSARLDVETHAYQCRQPMSTDQSCQSVTIRS